MIGVSQLSRAPELRPDKRPILSDLRESGEIEQDADVVGFIYRAAKYDEDADPSEADLIIAKHRNGPTGDVPVVFLEQYPRFVDRAGGGERPVEQRAGEGPPLDRPGRGGVSSAPRPVRLAGADERAQAVCPLGVCDGSGWILGPEDVARPCECRERRMARRRARGVRSVIPRRYRDVSLEIAAK